MNIPTEEVCQAEDGRQDKETGDKIKLLLIEDSPAQAMAIREMLEEAMADGIDFDIESTDTLAESLAYLSTAETDVILCDLGLPDSNGLNTFTRVHAQAPNVPIIVLTGMTDTIPAVRSALQKGAQDYLVKGRGDGDSLVRAIRYAIERKKTEEKLEEAIATKLQFTSAVSHELRTPLTAIKESVRLVHTEASGRLNDEQKELLDIARRNVDRLARLVNDVLDFQKLEAGKMDVNLCQNNINEVVTEVAETMTSLAKGKGLGLITNLDDSVPASTFDRDRITQVLTNLLSNAIIFTEQGSITVTATKKNNFIQVSIQDTGTGIEEEDVPKLFQEFEQIRDKDRQTGGTGLGLAISKQIIEQHNGKIWAESKPGEGTTFYFLLPIKERRADRRE